MSDWNAKVIDEFRANEGRVGGPFAGAPLVLVHHRGRKSGRELVSPMMYLPHETDEEIIYVFASKGGAPDEPRLVPQPHRRGEAAVERGTETYPVRVRELTGDERDQRYDEQARRYPGFAEYAQKTAGIRTIPVLELTRVPAAYTAAAGNRKCDRRWWLSAAPCRGLLVDWPGEAPRRSPGRADARQERARRSPPPPA